ncbi:heme-binding protein 1 isoform X2 [Ursus americanus]|uniref:heme-binding protein 1 isoform X2 n=1 Tax=Ursus americanus TaxID=9643 RepID=UPI000E6DAFD2|nr:heme-binding protein 1 isoform X2 [Ursus americanus]
MLGMIKNSLFGSVETWPWQVLSKGGKEDVSFEERTCEGGRFATVEVTDKPVDEALREAMPKVMKYVGGTNDKGIGMGMTVPISFAVFPGDDGSLQKKLKVWFRIPNQFQSNPPVPTDDSIKIEERESITVYSLKDRLGEKMSRRFTLTNAPAPSSSPSWTQRGSEEELPRQERAGEKGEGAA